MKEFFRYKKTIMFMLVIFITLLISGFSYAYYIASISQFDDQIGSTDCFKLTFVEDNNIDLSDAYPMTDEEAQNLVPYTFTITNTCASASYQVTLEELNNSTMNPLGIKYQLDNNTPAILGNIITNQNKVLDNSKSSRTLTSGILVKNESITYNLKIWIDNDSTKEQTSEKLFESKLVIVSNLNNDPYWNLTLSDELNDTEETIQIVKGRTINNLPTLTKKGYEFLGWYDSNDNEVTASSILNSDIEIHAKWLKLVWTITYDKNGGTSISKESEEIDKGSKISEMPTGSKYPDNEHTYSLEGWFDENNNQIDENSEINGNITLYAHWTSATRYYTITYNINTGTTISKATDSVTYGATISSLPTGSKNQDNYNTYSLDGWYTSASEGTKVTENSTTFTEDTELFAHWTPTTRYYTITYNKNGGNNPSKASDKVTYNGTISSLATCTKNSTGTKTYTLKGWYTSTASNATKITTSTQFTQNTTIYAQWTEANRTCNVTRTSNKWVATYSCVGGKGTMTACAWNGTTCNGGWSGSSYKLRGCQDNASGLVLGYYCHTSLNGSLTGAGFGTGTWSCSCPT